MSSAHELEWTGSDGPLGVYIVEESKKTLDAYLHQPNLVNEHANHEDDTTRGGYAHRQLLELVQNSADALASMPGGGHIMIHLTETCLYCADNGIPVDNNGVTALMFSHMSPKQGTIEIGRFGLGFKSLLGVSDAPEFFSRNGSFRFDHARAIERIRQVVPNAKRYPALRLPDPIDPFENRDDDNVLRELMVWATNIVRLPLKPHAHEDLGLQIRDFPPEFLLFVEHVHKLELNNNLSKLVRSLELQKVDEEYLIADDDATSRWKLFKRIHLLSPEAQVDRRSFEGGDNVPIWWAAPLDRLTIPGNFWAYFPTQTKSLVAGILNAPWKTNEDRQNLLPGPYNEELINVAAEIIAEALPHLATKDDPARHLDALPRRHEAGDTKQSKLLRERLFSNLYEHEIVPDQDGNLHTANAISYPPESLTPDPMDLAPFDQWSAFPNRPSNWLHHRALTRNRLAAIDRLFSLRENRQFTTAAPRATVAQWLEALVEGQEENNASSASMAAIQTAAHISPEVRSYKKLGGIVLTASGHWHEPDPERIFLPNEVPGSGQVFSPDLLFVHPELIADADTLEALKAIGIKPPSPESSFKLISRAVLDGDKEPSVALLTEFWECSRKVEAAQDVIRKHNAWRSKLYVRTYSKHWRHIHSVLLPGKIVPDNGSRDEDVTVDTDFHEYDIEMLCSLGVTETAADIGNLSSEPFYDRFRHLCRPEFCKQDGLRHTPHLSCLDFVTIRGVGPLEVLTVLSDEGKARYTNALLSLDATFQNWEMAHRTPKSYPKMQCESPAIYMLREYGRIRTSHGIFAFKDALGTPPKDLGALHALLAHPKADKIKKAFKLAEPTPEFIGEEDPIPLTDVWPGLEEHLTTQHKIFSLIRCERILNGRDTPDCISHASCIYLAGNGDKNELRELHLVSVELQLDLNDRKLDEILRHETRQEIERQRSRIKELATDAERLLTAVGKQSLRQGLPDSLLAILEGEEVTLTGIDIADAAIASYHSGALKQYRWALDHLNPPKQWAGSARAVDFVRSLGFSADWAGERNRRRVPYFEVEGRYVLPELHAYQQIVVENVKNMFRNGREKGAKRRGMISMPTGSGKTRVAVQAIVEAMRDDGLEGGVLWVAERDELCEQAVESWRQVWSSIGAHTVRLRVSRMWAGQPRPLPTSDLHVVIATIQTLHARFNSQPGDYGFLSDFKLIAFDEAHRSIAQTSTSVMQEIGLTRWQRPDEPFLLGLTATPYRGHDEEETARLVNRYGANRFDAGAFASDNPKDVISELQEMRVLAYADHETIEGGVFSLDANELRQMESVPWLPQSVEDRIAQNPDRTERIIEAYEAHVDPNWPTLIFATSVEHAKVVAALLNRKGIKSRAVSGTTEPSTRVRVVEEFRRGEIKALVNYSVFREGFDAPKTRAIIVARPVYSPNLYFQMIGRGLRGEKNGGNDRCLILNVQDNIMNFQKALAFSQLDWLWPRVPS